MQTTTIDDIEVIYESKTNAQIKIKGTPDAICKILQKLNNGNLNLKSKTNE
jgi:hypothetical protein